jgi:NAD(P)-dependent dehydrogenase (short-subunit alcohol dehydrogenase family)
MNAFRLDGKVAIVTGSSRGIGRSIAEHLAAYGAKVIVSSRKLPACEEVVSAIRAAGGQATAVPANISDKSQLENLVAETRKHFGRIDILVCNAASNPYFGPMSGLPDDAFQKILQNNIVSNHWLANLVLPEMAQRKEGVVIIVSSIGGLKGSANLGAYCVSKAADMQLARNLAVEWGKQNIRVNCIAPGLVKTDFARALWENPKLLAQTEAATPLGRIGEPDDIGAIAVFLASRAGAFVTGQTIVADGGVTISS